MTPSIGRIVHYRLSEQDCNDVFVQYGTTIAVEPGQVVPAIITRADNDMSVNLSVMLDGPGIVHQRSAGYSVETAGCWFWPPRIGA